jgi:uncharacterized membrane protein
MNPRMTWYLLRASQLTCFVFILCVFLGGGIAHFWLLDLFTRVVPGYIPFPRTVVMFTGICELAAVCGMLYRPLRQLTGWVLVFYMLCILPVHIDMLIHADRWPALSPIFLWGRPFLQPVLMAITILATTPIALATPPAR